MNCYTSINFVKTCQNWLCPSCRCLCCMMAFAGAFTANQQLMHAHCFVYYDKSWMKTVLTCLTKIIAEQPSLTQYERPSTWKNQALITILWFVVLILRDLVLNFGFLFKLTLYSVEKNQNESDTTVDKGLSNFEVLQKYEYYLTTLIYLYCAGITDIRLVNGSRVNEGRLEVLFNSIWGTVCDESFSLESTAVVCMQLGYEPDGSVFVRPEVFGQGIGPIWLYGVSCRGTELSLIDCPRKGMENHSCQHSSDVGIICRG